MARPKPSCRSSIPYRKGYASGWHAGVKKRSRYEKEISDLLDQIVILKQENRKLQTKCLA